MKYILKSGFVTLVLIFVLSGYALSAVIPDIPRGVTLEISGENIKVSWTANTDSTEGYKISYGLSSTSLPNSVTEQGRNTTSTTIKNLEPVTMYYVAVAAYIGNTSSSNSEVKSIKTGTGTSKPSTPENFRIQSLDSITETSINLAWKENDSSDLQKYMIYYGTASGSYSSNTGTDNAGFSAFTVNGLEPNRRYYFAITAINNDSQESDRTSEAVADTLPDTLAPPAPEISFAGMAGPDSISIRIRHTVPGLADIKGSRIHWGTAPGVHDNVIELGTETGVTVTGLAQDMTYYFSASAYDHYANESGQSAEKPVKIEKSKTLLSDDESFSGCFIKSSGLSGINARHCLYLSAAAFVLIMVTTRKNIRKYFLSIMLALFICVFFSADNALAVEGDNTFGIKWGYFKPSESLYTDIYDNNSAPVAFYYERRIYGSLFADIEAGYMSKSGYALTESGNKTGVKTELQIIPVSIGIQYEYEIIPYASIFGGFGGELWHVDESPSQNFYRSNKETVSGWSLKGGLKLFTQSEMFEGSGVLIESRYVSVNRFGSNDTDLGGLIFNAGFFYRF